VCDSSAEEGINLQAADVLIHVDLPWESFRVEQRIGRCDRHALEAMPPIPSMVVTFGEQPYAIAWFAFLADGCEVFSRSVSSLQYVLSDTERTAQLAVLSNGPEALTDAVDEQALTLAAEQRRIVAHDALDSLEASAPGEPDGSDAALLESDGRSTLTDTLVAWLESVGTNIRSMAPGVIRLERKPRPQVDFELELAIAQFMETPLALKRASAEARTIPLVRAGHGLVDAIATHLKDSDRGVAFALFRPAPGRWPPVVVLRTDYLISIPSTDPLLTAADALGLGDWVRQLLREAFPPTVETIVMTSDGIEAPAVLRQP
jgi:ATP-dependent helicase HepA